MGHRVPASPFGRPAGPYGKQAAWSWWGARATSGRVIDANTIEIRFSECVTVNTVGTCEISIDGGAWTACTGVTGSDKAWNFTPASAVNPGDQVRWRYVSGTNGITDCRNSEDIGDQQLFVSNPLVLDGDFILLETGGMSKMLLENDTDDTLGIQLENAS